MSSGITHPPNALVCIGFDPHRVFPTNLMYPDAEQSTLAMTFVRVGPEFIQL